VHPRRKIKLFNVLLTKSGGVLGPITSLLGWILNAIFEFLQLFNIENVAIVIILFTFIVRGLMIPLTIKQQKFTKLSSIMNPEITKINNKYKGKKDEASMKKQQLETQAVYQRYGASPTAGCLPMLIMLPIMFALYQVIYRIPAYVNDINELYSNIAIALQNSDGYVETLKSMADATVNVSKFAEVESGTMTINHIIDIMTKFKSDQWIDLATKFPDLASIISFNAEKIMHINKFIGGLNILDNPGLTFPAILIPILSGLLQFVQSKQMAASNPAPDKDNPMSSTMNTMNIVMPITSVFFCVMLPIGVGLYWVAGSVFAIIQQFVINKYMEKVDVEDLIAKNVEKQNKKKIKLGIDPNASMAELAKQNTKSIENVAETKTNSTKSNANAVKKNYEPSNYKKSTESYKAGSIAANANLLNNRNNDKGDK
jgi:YidC/Oxa1 family membrane protein insertase